MRLLRIGGALIALALGATQAAAQDTLKIAIGQINNWENQAPTLGEDAGIFKKHNLKIEAFGTQGAGETIQAVISGSADLGGGRRRRGRDARVPARRAGAHPAAGVHRHRRPLLVREGGLADQDARRTRREPDTIAYSTSGSSSNNIVVAFGQELGAKAKADRDRRAARDAARR